MTSSSSWRAPMHMPSRASRLRSIVPQRTSKQGADMIFAEALTTLDEYRQFTIDNRCAGARQPDRIRQDPDV